MTGGKRELKCGLVALETRLGWTLIGKTNKQLNKKKNTTLTVISMFTQEARITDLWRLDILGITDPILKKTKDKQQAEIKKNFRQTIKMDHEERYEVLFPWKQDHPPLDNNKDIAKRRLDFTTKKLKAQNI